MAKMKLAPLASKALSKREIVIRHAPIKINKKPITPSQDKNDIATHNGPNHKTPCTKWGFPSEEEGNCAFTLTHIVERVVDLCPDITTVAQRHETCRNALKGEALQLFENAVVAAQGNVQAVHVSCQSQQADSEAINDEAFNQLAETGRESNRSTT